MLLQRVVPNQTWPKQFPLAPVKRSPSSLRCGRPLPPVWAACRPYVPHRGKKTSTRGLAGDLLSSRITTSKPASDLAQSLVDRAPEATNDKFPDSLDHPQGLLVDDVQPTKSRRGRKTTSESQEDKSEEEINAKDRADEPKYSVVLQQALDNIRKHPGCVVVTRIGGFYELYFEQADEYGPLLGLKVAQRKTTSGPVSMAGFPYSQLERFLKTLVLDYGTNVAISEEYPNEPSGKAKSGNMFNRRVTRIVSPGTLVDEKFMIADENNFLMSISPPTLNAKSNDSLFDDTSEGRTKDKITPAGDAAWGISWVDVSTGQFFMQSTTTDQLSSQIERIKPHEIVVPSNMSAENAKFLSGIVEPLGCKYSHQIIVPADQALNQYEHLFGQSLSTPAKDFASIEEMFAISLVLKHISAHILDTSMKLQSPVRRIEEDNMVIDRSTIKGLELVETLRDAIPGGKGCLLHSIKRTATKGGARLLHQRIISPSTSIPTIQERFDLLEYFLQPIICEEVVRSLKSVFDIQRLVQKFSLGRGDADDLLNIAHTTDQSDRILALLQDDLRARKSTNIPMQQLIEQFATALEGPRKLAKRIRDAIDEAGVDDAAERETFARSQIITLSQEYLTAHGNEVDQAAYSTVLRTKATKKETDGEELDIWIMRENASPELEQAHQRLRNLRSQRTNLAEHLREKLNTPSLTLRWTAQRGFHCHVSGKKDIKHSRDNHEGHSIGSSQSTRMFHDKGWTDLGRKIDSARYAVRQAEQMVFRSLREDVIQNLINIRRQASILDVLDVSTSLASLAEEQDFCRPILDNSESSSIIAGRHPTVLQGLEEKGRHFVPNDLFLNSPSPSSTPSLKSDVHPRVWLITGPNMAGKSTFLRQCALIHILAQAGSFVPAAPGTRLGIVNAMFSRIGVADNLFQDQSTFMLEMLETAHILRHATSRSFVIMDEVGRGTATLEGEAVSWGVLKYLARKSGCRVLFATHFHSLVDRSVDEGLEGEGLVGMYCTDVMEMDPDSKDTVSHEVEPDVKTDDSGFVYLHKLRKGVNRNAHALKVCRMAELPLEAIETAHEIIEAGRALH